MRRSMRALGACGAVAALLLTGACGGGGSKPKPVAAAKGPQTTTKMVLLKSYDDKTGALRYQDAKMDAQADETIVASGPVQKAGVASNAQVLSAVNICSGDDQTADPKTGVGTKPCTMTQFAAAMKQHAKIDAYLSLRGPTVVKIAEIFHP
jgi:hypothetical protein